MSKFLARKRQAASAPRSAFAWATPAVCMAVAQGIAHPTAQKLGLFAVVHPVKAQPPLVHLPTHKLSIPPEYIVLIARKNERGKWDLRPVIRSAE